MSLLRTLLLAGLLLVAACGQRGDDQAAPPPDSQTAVGTTAAIATPIPAESPIPPSPTPVPPTPTPDRPLAALVNGQPIYLDTYERELARYEQGQLALGQNPGENGVDYRAVVLDALIEQALIDQAAVAAGLTVTPTAVSEIIDELKADAGDSANFEAWLSANQWSEEEFREALAAEMLRQQMVERVTAGVPRAVEQVRARYIQLDDLATAETVLARARAGDDFAFLARQFSLDRVTGEDGGDLGFFAPGSLLVPEIEQAAFALQPGQVSDILAVTPPGGGATRYYIVQVVERDPQRPLPLDLRHARLEAAFQAWLDELWANADIRRLDGG